MTVKSIFAEDLPKPVIWVRPGDCSIAGCNSAAESLFGYSEKSICGSALAKLLSHPEHLPSLIDRVDASKSSLVIHDVQCRGEPAELTLFPTGDVVAVLIVPLRAFTSQAEQGHPVRSLGQMIAHEIKNPLAGIKGAAQLLRDEVDTPENISLLDVITSEIDRVRRLAERLETFGDASLDAPQRCNVHTVLRNARKLMQHANTNVVFSEDYDPSLPHVRGDMDQLMQAVVNLIKNASEAIGDTPGDITLRTRSRAGARRGSVGLPVEIQVIDSGAGIPIAMQTRVFEPFVTTKPSGRGLGLAMVARTVEAHGGLVEVASKPGQTRFSILLPAATVDGDDDEL